MHTDIEWIVQCLSKLPKRQRVFRLDMSFIQYDASSRHGIIRIQFVPKDVDTVLCVNTFDNPRDCKVICRHAHDLLPETGVLIVVNNVIHPGMLRFALKKFDWKYITVVPDTGNVYAIAGKGEKPQMDMINA